MNEKILFGLIFDDDLFSEVFQSYPVLHPVNNINVVLERPITAGVGGTPTVSDTELFKPSSDSARYPGKQLEGYQENLRNGE